MVTAVTTKRPLTVDDLALLPEDGSRYEIIGGELYVTASPSAKHQIVALRLARMLEDFVDEANTGIVIVAPFDVRFGVFDVVQPDLLVLLDEQGQRLHPNWTDGTPDLVVEIVSPSTAGVDAVRKSALYASNGLKEYWLVDPETKQIQVQTLQDGRFVPVNQKGSKIRSELLGGLEIDLARLFDFPTYLDSDPRPDG